MHVPFGMCCAAVVEFGVDCISKHTSAVFLVTNKDKT